MMQVTVLHATYFFTVRSSNKGVTADTERTPLPTTYTMDI